MHTSSGIEISIIHASGFNFAYTINFNHAFSELAALETFNVSLYTSNVGLMIKHIRVIGRTLPSFLGAPHFPTFVCTALRLKCFNKCCDI